jgi:DNA-binding XRE family transcriptional regulator
MTLAVGNISFTDNFIGIRERVRAMREYVGLTRAELANRTGVNKDRLQKFETNEGWIRGEGRLVLLKVLAVLCKADSEDLRSRMVRVRTAAGVTPRQAARRAGIYDTSLWAQAERRNTRKALHPIVRSKILAQLARWEAELGGNS